MTAHAVAVQVFKIATMVTTVLMRISLLPDFNRWRKNKSTGDMSVLPSILIFTNCYAVGFYAVAIDNMLPLLATSILGVVVGVVFVYAFYRWTANKQEVLKAIIFFTVVCVIITIYSVLAICGTLGQSHSSVGTTLGFITIGTTTCMYASPMATIVRVVRTKTATSMPFTMGLVNVLNSFCWAVYGYLVGNMFLLAPNIVGVTLSSTQMLVTYIYRSKASPAEQDFSWTSEDVADQPDLAIVVDPSKLDDDRGASVAYPCKSPSFIALQSPTRDDMKRNSRQQ